VPTIPVETPQALPPAFGTAAFRGTVLDGSNPVADRNNVDPNPEHRDDPTRVRAVRVTEFSDPNRVRLGIVGTLREYAGIMQRFTGEFFVANSAEYHRVVNRRMARTRKFTKLVPNTRGVYRARTYGGARVTSDYTPGP
jgi:hypothetical protein